MGREGDVLLLFLGLKEMFLFCVVNEGVVVEVFVFFGSYFVISVIFWW